MRNILLVFLARVRLIKLSRKFFLVYLFGFLSSSIFLVFLGFYIQSNGNALSQKSTSASPTNKPIEAKPTVDPSPSYKPRKQMDYERILNSDFLEYRNSKIGFKILYPEDSEIHSYETIPFVNNPNDLSRVNEFQGNISFTIAAQTAEGTELFDGSQVEITYGRLNENDNLKSTAELFAKKKKEPYNTAGETFLTTLNEYPAFYVEELGYGGEYLYFLENLKTNYFITINYSMVGEDKEKLKPIVVKMLNSFQLVTQ